MGQEIGHTQGGGIINLVGNKNWIVHTSAIGWGGVCSKELAGFSFLSCLVVTLLPLIYCPVLPESNRKSPNVAISCYKNLKPIDN